jgi:hypothetical protein
VILLSGHNQVDVTDLENWRLACIARPPGWQPLSQNQATELVRRIKATGGTAAQEKPAPCRRGKPLDGTAEPLTAD